MNNGVGILEFEKPVIELEKKIEDLVTLAKTEEIDFSDEIQKLQEKCEKLKKNIFGSLTPIQKVQLARHPKRPNALEYIKAMFENFLEMHGDRAFADDKAIVGGLAGFEGESVMVIGQQKGRTTEDNIMRNFGMLHPEGYRKALRLMRLAEKFGIPVITLIDTPGADPGIGAEERGQAEAIATNLKMMAGLKVPVICAVTGEGGSGGALGIGVGNRVIMMENSVYSVISPEGCASILWRDSAKAAEAAEAMKLTAAELLKLKIIDEIVPEPLGGIQRDADSTIKKFKQVLLKHLGELKGMPVKELVEDRYKKFRQMGEFIEGAAGGGEAAAKAKRKRNKKQ